MSPDEKRLEDIIAIHFWGKRAENNADKMAAELAPVLLKYFDITPKQPSEWDQAIEDGIRSTMGRADPSTEVVATCPHCTHSQAGTPWWAYQQMSIHIHFAHPGER